VSNIVLPGLGLVANYCEQYFTDSNRLNGELL